MAYDERLVVVLAEISNSLFNKNTSEFAERILNLGIMEQTMVSVAAGIAMEGMTHHGSGDVQILRSLPGMQIVVPGTPGEFDALFREAYANSSPTYYRLAVKSNSVEYPVHFAELAVVKQGKQATVIAVGPMLASVLTAVEDMDVTVLYCTTVAPFDGGTLRAASQSSTMMHWG